MQKTAFSLPGSHIDALGSTAGQAQCSRAEIIRRAIGRHIEDFEDLSVAEKRLQDPIDPVLSWDKAKHGLHK
ncbi:MAG: CopG family transcriptional regulator [Gammaproteobacteria bacterium]|nr:CopG family transcriptional regulator [Gammaproteobacteria bacterium]